MKITRNDKKVFEFNLNHIDHGKWIMELLTVDGENSFTYSDPYPNRQACAAGAREFAKRAVKTDRYGWCIIPEINA